MMIKVILSSYFLDAHTYKYSSPFSSQLLRKEKKRKKGKGKPNKKKKNGEDIALHS